MATVPTWRSTIGWWPAGDREIAFQALERVGIVVVSLASARSRAVVYVKDIERAGLEVAGVHEVGLAETNFGAVAQQLVTEGAAGFIAPASGSIRGLFGRLSLGIAFTCVNGTF